MLCLVTQKDSVKDSSKKSNRQDNCEKMTYGSLKREIYLVVKIIFCNLAVAIGCPVIQEWRR